MTTDDRCSERVNVFAHSRRLRILRLLIARPEIGRNLATLQAATGYGEGPLLRHLEGMERKGLISRDLAGHRIAGPRVPGLPIAAMARAARRAHLASMPARKVA
ncbi:MAG: hypothetical protein R3D59_13235 [Paracoccaceae bacterium]